MAGRVCELFAGVGGFRLGLQESGWETVFSNQWEPAKKAQWASGCYVARFGPDGHVNDDVAKLVAAKIPAHDLLVGGFPCQDYSVATTLPRAHGIEGKKGVLWWQIHRILTQKRPRYVLLENVDRLLRSPHTQRGRDFGIILWCLADLGYVAEWRVLNAADYGFPQKRRRTFIFAALPKSAIGAQMGLADAHAWIRMDGVFAKPFPTVPDAVTTLVREPPVCSLPSDAKALSDSFSFDFQNAGFMKERKIWTTRIRPKTEPIMPLASVLQEDVPEEFFVSPDSLDRWRYLKGAKAEKRRAKNGHRYAYSEGALPFPDRLDQPSRTMITGEGGLSPSRFKHIILDPQVNRYRVLTPVECERLNGFPDNWTDTGMPLSWRYFTMGNALVVGLVARLGHEIVARDRSLDAQRRLPRVSVKQPKANVKR